MWRRAVQASASGTFERSSQNGARAVLSAVPDDRPLVTLLDAALRERGSSKADMVDLLRAYSNLEPAVQLATLIDYLTPNDQGQAPAGEDQAGRSGLSISLDA